MTICRKCGTSNKDSQKFCSFCHELLIADPTELEKIEQANAKKHKKAEKKLKFKLFRWKFAPLLLIPILLLDLIDLLLCVDLLFLGIGQFLGEILGSIVSNLLGYTTELFGNLVYTDQLVVFVVRGLEMLGAIALLLLACALSVLMIVYMVKWAKHKKNPSAAQQSAVASAAEGGTEAAAESTVVAFDMGGESVSYAELEDVAKHCAANPMPAPLFELSAMGLYESVRPYLWEYDDQSVRRILSAMSCSRLLVCSAGAVDSAGVFDSLARALGVRAELHVYEETDDVNGGKSLARLLLQKKQAEEGAPAQYMHTAFAKALYAARFAPTNLFLAGIRGLGAAELGDVFAPLQEYFKLPDSGVELYLGRPASMALPEGISGGLMTLSPNVWMLSILPDDNHALNLDNALAPCCAVIYLRNSQNVLPPEDLEGLTHALPSVSAWENAVAAAEQEYYLSEELWSVIDAIEEQMQEVCGTRISNRTLRAFERYTAVFLALGGKMNDAFDNGLAAVILPAYAKQICALCQKEEGETLVTLLSRMVGKDRLPVTMEALASMGL
ncbi:MAG: zinc ribbon domain-containing protein [Ruminococcaceae bacterium]|nr:zinc ribbon domain-containing protein [Oscillospiraceae bacterium]